MTLILPELPVFNEKHSNLLSFNSLNYLKSAIDKMDPGRELHTAQYFMSLGFVWLDSGSPTGKESEVKFLCTLLGASLFVFNHHNNPVGIVADLELSPITHCPCL